MKKNKKLINLCQFNLAACWFNYLNNLSKTLLVAIQSHPEMSRRLPQLTTNVTNYSVGDKNPPTAIYPSHIPDWLFIEFSDSNIKRSIVVEFYITNTIEVMVKFTSDKLTIEKTIKIKLTELAEDKFILCCVNWLSKLEFSYPK